ncbi:MULTISPECIES: heavy metal translocating P-type ATPase [Vibrio]|uniref:P-type Cu(2+) transporter n=1 Tax=Vibrio algicola TaxID=2662262 RepID=A0A5Q0TGC8_9VIBR|nr:MULTISPECIES: heavy metal translocating P-type ATPase [Vibrio]MBD1575604.1 heavy metal translocating P-type ATPase [Vibrio sp. S11_S32]
MTQAPTIQACYHCGDVVPDKASFNVEILGQSREMCCPGCQSVAQTILDSGLVSYYQYRTAPAEKADLVPEQLKELIHYDNKEVQSEFVRHSANTAEVTLSLEGVSCAACAWLIEKQLSSAVGVIQIRVNITTSRAILCWDDTQTKLSELLKSIHQLGYKAAPFEPNKQEENYHQMMKQYLYRLGVAGLATMQVMMLAVALYFEVFSDLDNEFKQYLRYVSLIFATPVLLYSAQPFYTNAWRSLKARTLGMDVPVSIALIFAYFASVWATVAGKGEVFFESISMFTFFLLIGRFLEMRARRKAATASANLLKLIPAMARKIDGTQIPVRSLQIGDCVRVLPGEHIPADGKVTRSITQVDESMLTGESIPVLKQLGDFVFAGTINVDEAFDLEVTCHKADSVISNIVRLQDEAEFSKPKIAEVADHVAKYFVAVILLIALFTWLYWHQYQPESAFWIMLSVLVATCPCALSLATPTAVTCATSRLSSLGILLRKGHVFETLCKVNHIVVDKTGTLTAGDIHINKVTLTPFALQQNLTEADCLAIAASLEQFANHPIAHAFNEYKDSEIAFTEVNNVIGSGLSGQYQGEQWRIGNLSFAQDHNHSPFEPSLLNEDQTALTHQAPTIYLSSNGQLMARFEYNDPIRPETPDFIKAIQDTGIDITILTGDTQSSTQKTANSLGIKDYVCQAKPEDKLAYLNRLNKNQVTLMIGDGINDAPTLAGAHLSVAMGGGSDVAKASADMVLLGDKLNKILEARQLALFTRKIIRQNLAWALGYNLVILPLAVMGLVAPYIAVVGMSLSSIIVVTNSLRLIK